MFTDTITYTDFDGNERKEKIYFNLTKAEALKLDASNYAEYLQSVLDSEDPEKILDAYERFIDLGYGEKSEDGRRFVKSDEILQNFKTSLIFDEFYFKLLSDPNYAVDFMVGILPDVGLPESQIRKMIADGVNKNTDDVVEAELMPKEVARIED